MSNCPRLLCRARLILYKAFFFCGLLAACLFPTASARAGSWSGPSYTFSGTDGTGKPWKWPINSGTYFNANSPGYSASGSASGTVTATFTWTPDPNNPSEPPTPLCVLEKANANAGDSTETPSADDGLGDAATGGPTFVTSQGSHLTLAGTTSPVVLTHTLSATCPNGIGEMTYQAIGYPVTLGLGGTIQNSSDGSTDILIGQKCTASLSGGGGTLSGWQWKVGGTTFQSWTVSQDQTTTTYVDGPGPLDIATPSWYWNDSHPTPETVSCMATVTPPAGEGSPFTVTATKQVTVMQPTVTATGTGGNMQVNTAQPGTNGSDFFLHAGPTGSYNNGGMDFTATVSPPTGTTFGAGGLTMVQLIIPNDSFSGYNDFGILCNYTWSLNGQEGLDGGYPSPTWNTGAPFYSTFDSPGLDLTHYKATSVTMADQFEDYIMYTAPGSSQVVPVAHFVWSINGSASIPSSGNWADFTGSAGTVSPSGKDTPFASSNSFPSWTQIDSYANGRFSYFVH